MDLFDYQLDQSPIQNDRPLAEKLRPRDLQGLQLNGDSLKTVQQTVDLIRKTGKIPNLILWGPPGSGKTTLALLLSRIVHCQFLQLNAVDTGAKQLKEIGAQAKNERKYQGRQTVAFIDEIHRLNKAQQDVLLPFTESGDLSLIGATTENPGYELNGALLSRSRVIVLSRHSEQSLRTILASAAASMSQSLSTLVDDAAFALLLDWSNGDARKALNALEQIIGLQPASPLTPVELTQLLGASQFPYDKSADEHYDTVSAFIKSIRGSDPDAAVYYLARMLAGGEDPKFIARRLIISASEDIGNADPKALGIATAGFDAVERVGLPEAAITLSQVTCYLASCPKSNRAYLALKKAQEIVRETGSLPIPKALRSAQTSFAKAQGYGAGYRYSHEGEKGYLPQQFLPEEIKEMKIYEPVSRGFEKTISDYLKWLKA